MVRIHSCHTYHALLLAPEVHALNLTSNQTRLCSIQIGMTITELNPPIIYSQMGSVEKNVDAAVSMVEQKCRYAPQCKFLETTFVPELIGYKKKRE
jgi:hypothetical protein